MRHFPMKLKLDFQDDDVLHLQLLSHRPASCRDPPSLLSNPALINKTELRKFTLHIFVRSFTYYQRPRVCCSF